jgi:hypothetical protein
MGHHSENIPYGIRTRVLSINSTGVLRWVGGVEAKRKPRQKPKIEFRPNYKVKNCFSACFFLACGLLSVLHCLLA